MKTLLITGFDPFGGEKLNPSWEAVSRLDDTIGAYRLEKLQIPTVFGKAAQTVLSAVREKKPDAVLCIGQAGGRSAVTPEYVAINLRYATIFDNEKNMPQDIPVIDGAPKAYFSTLPVRKMANAIEQAGVRSQMSYSAGTFVCNDLLFTLLHEGVACAFIHVPYLPEQAKADQPSMPLEQIVRALTAAISALY
ncbi:MAG: pyroglutamyl-peptidase I [Ruminococcaceae bacterium]|nr:pyroglutamyl-peptidase I [Oscillospiraceae bacterium]